MKILERLGVWTGSTSEDGDTDTVKRIARELEALDSTRARFLAAFAYVLSRVAHADSRVCVNETTAIRDIVQKLGHLPENQAVLVVEIAKSQARLFGGTENFLVTREFRDIATPTERLHLLDCVFAVAAADGAISTIEESQAGQIAKELGFTQPEYASALAVHGEHRSVLQRLR
ncbi:MAG: TerB family tellurite resistance protein [Acidobacteriota bacterium]|nr:TerB family tellurite resistance protein [Acidobacteriota bacterium]